MLVLFDIDSTLIGGDGVGRRAFARACHEILEIAGALDGVTLDGMTDPLILAGVCETHLKRAPRGDEDQRVFAAYLRHLAIELEKSTSFHIKDGVAELLDLLEARDAIVGLATGNLREGARLKLERGKLWHRFAFGGFGSDAGDRGELTRIGLERGRARAYKAGRDIPAEQTFVVGDTPKDVYAAHAAGAIAIGVATGSHSAADLRAAGADIVCDSLRDWLAVL